MTQFASSKGGFGSPGFTWLEITIIVVIIAVIAAVAFPVFWKNIRRAKTAEAEHELSVIYRAATSYYAKSGKKRTGEETPPQHRFPDDIGPSPGDCTLCSKQDGGRCVPGVKGQGTYIARDVWEQPTWKALGFSIDHPHYFVYEFNAKTSDHDRGAGSHFTAGAHADLDNDGICSTYERLGTVKSDGSFEVHRGVIHEKATE